MAIDRFDKARFEAALPIHNLTGVPLWHDITFENGEFVYGIDVPRAGHDEWITIYIRSSIGMDLLAKETGKDSIRMYTMRKGKPWGSKISCYTTRVKGWEERMTKQLRILYKRCMNLKVCKLCGGPKAVFKKAKDNSLFQACPDHFSVTYENYKE